MNERIIAIDVLRGFAILGILIMNIVSFSMPSASYFNPLAYTTSPFDQIIFDVSHVLADQKFMAVFSMLFGASTLLFIESAIKKGKNSTSLFYRRNFWLLIIGLLHSVFIWYGDILLVYALCSFVLFFFRKLSTRTLLIAGTLIYLIPALFNAFAYFNIVDSLTPVEQASIIENWQPNSATIQKEINAYQGNYAAQFNHRLGPDGTHAKGQPNNGEDLSGLSTLLDFFGRSFGMMLIGMALFKTSVFNNQRSRSFYAKLVGYGFSIGIALAVLGVALFHHFNWEWRYGVFLGRIPNHIATPFIALGYIGLIMLWTRSTFLKGLQERLKDVGKTALTSYLMESIIGTFVFYGVGLGLFGTLHRGWQLGIVVLIWGILMLFAPMWLKRFQYGPVEWMWRSLTYFKWMPLRKKE